MKTSHIAALALSSLLILGCTSTNSNMTDQQIAELSQKAALENIMSRTSVRKYQAERTVEAEKVEALVRAGMAAPSAVNKQPWHFVVVDDKTALDSLAKANPRAKMLQTAPLAIVVCGDMQTALEGEGRAYWIQDCSAATENILLAANALGLGAVWTGLYPFAERYEPVQQALSLPSTIVPLCTIVIGYPDGQTEAKDKYKAENVSHNVYGGQ